MELLRAQMDALIFQHYACEWVLQWETPSVDLFVAVKNAQYSVFCKKMNTTWYC